MRCSPLLWDTEELQVERVQIAPEAVTLTLRAGSSCCPCPCCGTIGRRVHSRYTRTLQDLPAYGRVIRLRVRVRRFLCDWRGCGRRTFAEPLAELTRPHARKTSRLIRSLRELAFATGGEAGADLAQRLAMPASPDTLLRLMRGATLTPISSPRVLGVDDWSFQRGQRYGTILCDLEAQRPIDLLPERSSVALSNWLRLHPGTQVISRDRSMEYAKGATIGAPEAAQVADRFHLRKNITEALMQALDRRQTVIAAAAKASAQVETTTSTAAVEKPGRFEPALGCAEATGRTSRKQQGQEQRRAKQLARYQQIKQLEAE